LQVSRNFAPHPRRHTLRDHSVSSAVLLLCGLCCTPYNMTWSSA
jgi:hypothetical protein